MAPSIRVHKNEQLDNLALAGEDLEKTLSSLHFINRLFGCHRQLINAVIDTVVDDDELLQNIVGQIAGDENTIRITDLGSGGGDCILELNKRFAKNDIVVNFTGIDGNPNSTQLARKLTTCSCTLYVPGLVSK